MTILFGEIPLFAMYDSYVGYPDVLTCDSRGAGWGEEE